MAFLTQIDTSTLSNQNISSSLNVHTYTNTSRIRKVFVGVDLDQIAGNGSYSAYITIQRAGAGSEYRFVTTTDSVPSGVTAKAFTTIPIVLNATDVLKVYVTGLAGDTTTPDITTRVWEELPAITGDAMTLTSGERTSIANEVEAQIIDETDSEKVLLAITNKIAAAFTDLDDLSLAAIASAVRSALGPELTLIATDGVAVDLEKVVNPDAVLELPGTSIASVSGAVGSVTELSAAQSEPGQGAPAANASPLAKIAYLFKAWRNKKTQTSSDYKLYADDASTVDQKASVSDDGSTTTIGEVATGP